MDKKQTVDNVSYTMAENRKPIILVLLILLAISSIAVADAPYSAWTINSDGKRVLTQIPYYPAGMITGDFAGPQDIFIDTLGNIYIADAWNSRIVIMDKNGANVRYIGQDVLIEPTGVFVDEFGRIYVADYGSEQVYVFEKDGSVLKTFERPTSPLFGKNSKFKPQKLVVDKRGNVYVISEGSVDGVIQLNNAGEFLGYFGVNTTNLGILQVLQRMFYTESQISQLFKITPPSPDNIAIDRNSIIYTYTRNAADQNVKKLNVAGLDTLEKGKKFFPNGADITVDKNGNIFVVDDMGYIYEYDNFGDLLFVFGRKADDTLRLGQLRSPSGIAVDDEGTLYVLDKELNSITVFKPTVYANQVHEGLFLYNQGLYVESQKNWENVLRMNSNFLLAHKAIGKAYYKQQEYDKALEEFRISKDKKEYSNAFWEIRQAYLMRNASKFIIFFIVLWLIYRILRFVDRKYNTFRTIKAGFKRFFSIRIVNDLNKVFSFIAHPIDSFYDLKWENRPGPIAASILYILLFLVQVFKIYYTGFIFNNVDLVNVSLLSESLKLYIPIVLWVVMNYLIGNISDGEGRLKDIYVGTAYALSPYIVFTIPLVLLSNVLTLNEAFIYQLGSVGIIFWCVVLIYTMIMQVHDYSFFGTLKNILVTLFAMAIVCLVAFILYVVWNQVYAFIYDIVQEVITRV
ncbi:MAG TPA: YIP1 family protein [Fervidobacterium sp.]|nr:YIP1 family protein [Fervidobacterium sp.]